MMIELIVKDISSQIKYVGFFGVLYLVFCIIPNFPGETFLSVGIVMTSLRLAYVEEKNNTLFLLKTMPLKTSTIVVSKYLSELVIALVFAAVAVTLNILGLGAGEQGLLVISIVLPIMLVFVGAYFAMFFKIGYIKASNYLRLLFFVVFIPLLIPQVGKFFNRLLGPLDNIDEFTLSHGFMIAVILLIVYFATSLLAIWFFNSREDF